MLQHCTEGQYDGLQTAASRRDEGKTVFVISDPDLIQDEQGRPDSVYYYRLTGEASYRDQDVYVIVVVGRYERRRTVREDE